MPEIIVAPSANHRVKANDLMTEKLITRHMPAHLQRWLRVVQRLPLALMLVFTLAVLFDNQTPIGTLTLLKQWGIPPLAFASACAVSCLYLLAASRQITWQSAIHFGLGTLPILFYVGVNIFRAGQGIIPWTAVVIYAGAYALLLALYWLAIALAEWLSRVAEQGSVT